MTQHPSGDDSASKSDAPRSEDESLTHDPVALGRAMEACRPYLLLVANKEIAPVLRPKGGASDLVQETFLEAHRDLDQFSGRSARELKGWLRRILRNNLANFFRRYRGADKRQVGREVSLDRDQSGDGSADCLVSSTLSPSGQAILSEQAARLERALDRLPERERLVLIWRNHDHCQWDEIGRRLGGSADMARKAWSRAVERLRNEVGDIPGPTPDGRAPD
jgi:RNA polymerase sigma-70 factor (ECF subfamily)